jgi:methyl coenzyme M reductase subunit C
VGTGCVVGTANYVRILDEGQNCTWSRRGKGMGVSRWEMVAKRNLEILVVLHMGAVEDHVVAGMGMVACVVEVIAYRELAALVLE